MLPPRPCLYIGVPCMPPDPVSAPARLKAALARFLRRHPLVREAALWALPAMLVGVVLRLILLSYLPYANWNADSRSYYSFAHNLTAHGYFSFYDKRRFLYPIFLLPVSLLPGAPMRWLVWIQHALGVISLLPLAYTIRKTTVCWKAWIIPCTLLYTAMPMVLWFERELLAETIFFDLLLWSVAGWVAWISERQPLRQATLFWAFLVPYALFNLTRPAARFFWPGVIIGVLIVGAWRRLNRWQWGTLGGLFVLCAFMGSKILGPWLLLVSSFPLVQVDTPLHADYKAQIRDKVEYQRAHLETYYDDFGWPFDFLRDPSTDPQRPLWAKLHHDELRMRQVYSDLAKEAIRAEPLLYLRLGLQRFLASANPSEFSANRFRPEFYPKRFEHFYDEVHEGEKTPVRELFALPKTGPLIPYAEFRQRLSPEQECWQSRLFVGWTQAFGAHTDLFAPPPRGPGDTATSLLPPRPTLLGCWLLAGIVLSLFPRYFSTLGVWTLGALSYLSGVFLVTIVNYRYFDAAWPILIVLLALPADALVARILPYCHPGSFQRLEGPLISSPRVGLRHRPTSPPEKRMREILQSPEAPSG